MQALLRFLKSEDGPTAVEYAVMLGLIIITAMSAIAAVGNSTNVMWSDLIKGGLDKI